MTSLIDMLKLAENEVTAAMMKEIATEAGPDADLQQLMESLTSEEDRPEEDALTDLFTATEELSPMVPRSDSMEEPNDATDLIQQAESMGEEGNPEDGDIQQLLAEAEAQDPQGGELEQPVPPMAEEAPVEEAPSDIQQLMSEAEQAPTEEPQAPVEDTVETNPAPEVTPKKEEPKKEKPDNKDEENKKPKDLKEKMDKDVEDKVASKLAGFVADGIESITGKAYPGPTDTQDREQAARFGGSYLGAGLGGLAGMLYGPKLLSRLGGAAGSGMITRNLGKAGGAMAGIPLGFLLGGLLGRRGGAEAGGLAYRGVEGLGGALGDRVPEGLATDIALGTPYNDAPDEASKEMGYRALGGIGGLALGAYPGLRKGNLVQALAGGALLGVPSALLGSRLAGAGSYSLDGLMEFLGKTAPGGRTSNGPDDFRRTIGREMDSEVY